MHNQEECVYYADSYLHFYDCDRNKKAKLSTILKYIADIAGVDYTKKGFSHQYLWDHGMVFLLSRTSVAIHRMPDAYETITVSTWERGKKGSQFLRDFELFDQAGNCIVSAATAWLLVDPVSRKILRPSVFTHEMPARGDKLPACEDAHKLHMPEEHEIVGKRLIRYSDLDGNGHVYNAVYGDIAYDYLPLGLADRPLAGFQINYQSEAVLGEELNIYFAESPEKENSYYVEGRNAQGGNCYLCKLDFA